jgi:signal transduction histidine kinase
LIGYACNVPSFYGWRTLFPDAAMGLHTATMFALLGVGILAARADRALMKVIASDTSGGLVARRLLLAPVIIPLITGLLQISGRRTGLYNAEFASWFFAFLNIVVFTFVIWWIATLLYRMDESRRRAEESLRQKTVELQAANEELESFASSVAHDLHAPARHVAGFAQIVLEDHGREMGTAAQRHLGQIAEAAERMGHLISSLLAFSRLTRVDLRHTTVDLNTVVKNVLRQLEPDVQGRDTDIRVAPLPTVRADQTLITQVFANLIANALKYTRDRTPAVIEIGCHDGRPGHSVFFVRDNGAGFDMKHAGKLFRIFERLHSPDQFEGTGVGLSTVQRIIQRHGGQVWAEGEVDKGATFYFTLPTEPPSS